MSVDSKTRFRGCLLSLRVTIDLLKKLNGEEILVQRLFYYRVLTNVNLEELLNSPSSVGRWDEHSSLVQFSLLEIDSEKVLHRDWITCVMYFWLKIET